MQLSECMCVGSCQETAELSGMRCRLHSLALGVSIMRATQGCLSVGERFSTFSIYIHLRPKCEQEFVFTTTSTWKVATPPMVDGN